jgi:hypothetical protein
VILPKRAGIDQCERCQPPDRRVVPVALDDDPAPAIAQLHEVVVHVEGVAEVIGADAVHVVRGETVAQEHRRAVRRERLVRPRERAQERGRGGRQRVEPVTVPEIEPGPLEAPAVVVAAHGHGPGRRQQLGAAVGVARSGDDVADAPDRVEPALREVVEQRSEPLVASVDVADHADRR